MIDTEKQKETRRKYREANRERIRAYNRQWESTNDNRRQRDRAKRVREWFQEYKTTLVCSRCSENHPACLDFHHIDPKTKLHTIASMIVSGFGKTSIQKEIAKCVVLCANCHRKEHASSQSETPTS